MSDRRTRPKTFGRLALLAGAGILAVLAAAGLGLGAFGNPSPPPSPRISSAPMRTTVARAATFAFEGLPTATFECAVDARGFRRCPQRVTYRRLGLGAHEFRVRARSREGIAGAPASYVWRILAPRPRPKPSGWRLLVARPVMITVPVRPSVSRRATFAWRGRPGWKWTPGTRFQCLLDRRGWKRCRSPRSYTGLALGKHVFRVRAKERSGRLSRPNSFHWTISRGPLPGPVEFTSRPAALTDERGGTIGFAAGRGEATECRLDNGAWQTCASPVFLVGLAPGTHIFCVRALGPLGNPGLDTCVAWLVVTSGGGDPVPGGAFTILGDLPAALAPGVGGALPLSVRNPFDFDLRVTDLVVAVAAGTSNAGCDGPANLQVTQSNSASGVPLIVPAGTSVTLPAQGVTAPTVTMRNLSVNQDACKGASFTFGYSGTGSEAG